MTNTVEIYYEEHPLSPRLFSDKIGYLITREDSRYDSCIEEISIYEKIQEYLKDNKTTEEINSLIKDSFTGVIDVYAIASQEIDNTLKLKRSIITGDRISEYNLEGVWGWYIITEDTLQNFYQRKGINAPSEYEIETIVNKEMQDWSYYVSGEVFRVKEYDHDGRWMLEKRNIYGFSEIGKYISDESKNIDLNDCLIDP